MKRKAEKTWIMMALLLVSVSSMVKTSNSETRESAHAFNSYSTSSAVTEWSERYGGLYDDAAYSLVNTSDGYALAGSTSSSGAGSYDFWLVKTDSNGNKAWDRPYGGVGDDVARCVIQTSDGGYALAGFTNSPGNGDYDFWLVKTNSQGTASWNKIYGGVGDDEAYSVIQTSDNGYALAGFTNSPGNGDYDFWLVKTDSNGTELWNETYGGPGDDEAYSVIQTSDNGYALAGFTNSSGNGGSDFWLVKTDSNGTELWNETYGGPRNDEAYSIVQAGDGGYVLAGYTNSLGAGSSDFWVVKTDASGNQQWDKTYGESYGDKAYCVVQANGGGYALAGYTYSPSMNNDARLVKTAAVYYTLNITITAGGTTDPTNGTYTYANWTDVPVTAYPNPGYLFDHWELDGNSTGTVNSTDVLMDKGHQLKAVFALSQCTLNITTTAGGTTDPTPGTHTYPYSSSISHNVNVTAYPDYGNYLDHWVYDGKDTNTPSNYIPVPMNMNHTLDAVFRCPHDIAVINVTASKTSVGQGQSTEITCTISNVGKYKETSFGFYIYATLTKNQDQRSLYIAHATLLIGSNLPVTKTWDTSSYSMGNYTVTCSVEQVGNETIMDDNTFVSSSIAVTIPGDLDGNFTVGLSDLVILARAYGSKPGDSNWNANADIDGNRVVGLSDLVILAQHYGQHYP